MSDHHSKAPSPKPILNAIAYADVFSALRNGWRDFTRAPAHALFFGGVYALCGIMILWLLTTYQKPWMVIPFAIGFPLVGPFLAAGTYEISRRLEAGEPLELRGILAFMAHQSRREFSWMAFVVLFIFWIWMYQARILIALFLEMRAFSSMSALGEALFLSSGGLMMLAVGTVIGGILAAILFTTTVISMPMLVHRELDIVTAIVASWKTVIASPGPMLLWGLIIAGITFVSMIPMFLGLVVSFPVLGFATWHLYGAAVAETRKRAGPE